MSNDQNVWDAVPEKKRLKMIMVKIISLIIMMIKIKILMIIII